MVGIATGLAEAGFLPFAYSIANFVALRPYEFIRNGPAAHGLPVRLVGVGGGFEYGPAGPTHHALEDLGVMRLLPEVTVIAPADHAQAANALRATWDHPGPVYYRLGKDESSTVPGLEGRFQLGRVELVRQGGDGLILTTGAIAGEAWRASDLLAERAVYCAVGVLATLQPLQPGLRELLRRFGTIVTVEAHRTAGGLGSLVAEMMAEEGMRGRLIRRGVAPLDDPRTGGERFLNRLHGLTAEQLADDLSRALPRAA
jgi:transketolase